MKEIKNKFEAEFWYNINSAMEAINSYSFQDPRVALIVDTEIKKTIKKATADNN